MMKTFFKYAAAATLTGALALAAATPSQAHWRHGHGRHGAAIGGFAVGAAIGAAAATALNGPYYYDYGPAYAYDPDYGHAGDAYAYEPAPAYDSYGYDAAPNYGYYGSGWANEHSTNNFSIDSQR
jgi:hypothetical protein